MVTDGGDPSGVLRNVLSGQVAARDVVMAGTVNITTGAVSRPGPPRQLRPALDLFTDRLVETALLDTAILSRAAATAVFVLLGQGGVGKTALALKWLNGVAERYPDGQFQVDLGGGRGERVAPSEALGQLLRAAGFAPEELGATLDERAGQWLTWSRSRRIALLLEDPLTAGQVRPLLPNAEGSVVVITSRSRLESLRVGSAPVEVRLGPFADAAALELLAGIAGARVVAEPAAARELAKLCGGLPLTLVVAGARLQHRPHLRVERMVARLAGERPRLLDLSAPGDDPVRRVFDVAYQELPAPVARLYRALGSHPGPEFSLAVAAAAVGADEDETQDRLDVLLDQSLIEEVAPDRYRFHSLFWDHAAEQARSEETSEALASVRRAIVDWYLAKAVANDVQVMPERWRVGPAYPKPPEVPKPPEALEVPDASAAMAWLEGERTNLVAAVKLAAGDGALDDRAWQLCQALWSLCFRNKHHQDGVETHKLGIEAAERLGDRLAEAKLRSQLGFFRLGLRETAAALEEFTLALDAARAAGDRQAQSTALESLGLAALGAKRYADALGWFEQARHVADPGNPRALALLTHHRGRALSGLGRHDEARTLLADALRALAALPDPYNEARVRTSLGEAELRAGAPGDAGESLGLALAGMRRAGVPLQAARILVLLGVAERHAGNSDQARTHLAEAATLFATPGTDGTHEVSRELAEWGEEPAR